MSSPDILDCLANLSSDEVFTPPKLANEMLDLLPSSLWRNPNARFCDPFTKSGVFLREIGKRLDAGLSGSMPDKDERIRHILGRQVYGIAITRLTALLARRTLYCNKDAHGSHAAIQRLFRDECGLVAYSRSSHRWKNGTCEICGASEKAWGKKRSADVENYAYPFLHDERIIKMAEELGFDVVSGNPPYQAKDGGNSASAKPVYQEFVTQAKKLNPHYLCMIIPARWYTGGKGLDEFRSEMLSDDRVKIIYDYVNSKDCFSDLSVSGGICYFLWDRNYHGECKFTTVNTGVRSTAFRRLDEFPVFIRYNEAVSVVHKIQAKKELSLESILTSRNPFGIPTNARGAEREFAKAYKLYSSKGSGYVKAADVLTNKDIATSYKVMVTRIMREHAGEPDKNGQLGVLATVRILAPKEVCTDTYIAAGKFKTEDEAKHLADYLRSKFVRFLLLQAAASINLSKTTYRFVPIQDFSKSWTDAELYKKYGLDEMEISFIESMIRPMEEAR